MPFSDNCILVTFAFWKRLHFGDICVLGHLRFGDNRVLVKFTFVWEHLRFGGICILVIFQFWFYMCFGDICVLVTFGFG